jgi:hypothetical protein
MGRETSWPPFAGEAGARRMHPLMHASTVRRRPSRTSLSEICTSCRVRSISELILSVCDLCALTNHVQQAGGECLSPRGSHASVAWSICPGDEWPFTERGSHLCQRLFFPLSRDLLLSNLPDAQLRLYKLHRRLNVTLADTNAALLSNCFVPLQFFQPFTALSSGHGHYVGSFKSGGHNARPQQRACPVFSAIASRFVLSVSLVAGRNI